MAAEVEVDLDRVPRRAGLSRNDRDLAPREGVEEGRLAGVRRPRDRHRHAVAEPGATGVARELIVYEFPDAADEPADLGHESAGETALLGEIDGAFGERQRRQEVVAQGPDPTPERPIELAQGLPALRLGLGVDQVGQTLDGAEIHLAIDEGAARELASLGRPASRDRGERPQHRRHDGAAAMHLELGRVLAGEARWPRKPQDQGTIEDRARGVAERSQRGTARGGTGAGEGQDGGVRCRTRHADHRDGRPPRPARGGEDGIGGWGHVRPSSRSREKEARQSRDG